MAYLACDGVIGENNQGFPTCTTGFYSTTSTSSSFNNSMNLDASDFYYLGLAVAMIIVFAMGYKTGVTR